jgi:hypothetical protein
MAQPWDFALKWELWPAKAKPIKRNTPKLVTCDGPPYYYKVAYEEAERFLENLR